MRTLLIFCLLLGSLFSNDIVGFWQTIDKRTHQPTSVIAIYTYQGRYYGKIIATCNQGVISETIYAPRERAPGIKGSPYYCGLDIIWTNPTQRNGKYFGYVMDPDHGKVYDAELWRDHQNLVLRGKVMMFGRNEVWPPFPESGFNEHFPKPDIHSFVPAIYKP